MQAIDMTDLVRRKLRYYELFGAAFVIAMERAQFIRAVNETVNLDAHDAVEYLQKITEIDDLLKKSEQAFNKAVKLLANLADDASYSTTPPQEF